MRIIEYPKYILSEETQECSLRNCPVVIDGQNYLHYMYEKSRIPYVFGCEADKYFQYLKRLFKMYKDANVKCYIVFKGGDTDVEKKIKKFQHLIFDFDTNCEFVAPIFLKDATVQMVDEMGMNYAFCVTESKDECVALAQKLECPIISFDIEYCFRKAPYIPSATMKFDKKTNSIQCYQYKLQDFLHKNSLTEEKTAIFAALTDSTVFPIDFFDSLLKTWGVLNIRQYLKLKHLILWLSEHSEQEARDGISKTLSNDEDRDKFWIYYHKILTNMRKDESGHVTEYLLNSNIPILRQDPEWFEKGVVCKHVSRVYINLYKSKVIEGSCYFDTNSQDNLLLSLDIVKYAYNLLTNYRGDTFKVYQDANTYIEIDTDDPNVRKPSYNCSVSVFENGWDQVKHLKLFEHFVTENNINTEGLAKLRPDCVVLFIALVYFARRKQLAGEDVTREVYAVVLSYVMLSFVFNRNTRCKDWKESPAFNRDKYKNWKEFVKVKVATAKYYQYNEVEAKRIFDGKALSSLMELQYCIQHMNYLNTLCGSPYESTQYRKSYNGTFVYKMFCDMREYGDCEEFVNKLLQMAPTVLAVVRDLFQVYRELLMNV